MVLSNCPDVEYLGSGYVIHHFTVQLRKYFDVTYFDVRDYELFPQLRGRANLYRQSIGKVLLTFQLFVLKGRRFDVVEFWGADSFLAILFVKWFYPSVLRIHHSNGLESKYVPIMEALEGQKKWYHLNLQTVYDSTCKNVHAVVTTTKADALWAKGKFNVVTKGIAPALSDTFINASISFQAKKNIIGFVGTWLPKKGIDLIISDLPLVLKENQSFWLYLIGVGNEVEVRSYFPDDVQQQVKVFPFVENKVQLFELYKEMKILILPSKAESFGIVTIEAMATGCAIIASNMGYAADLVQGEEVLLLNTMQKGELKNLLLQLINDKSLLQKISSNNYEKAQTLRWEESGKELADSYSKWLKELKNEKTIY